MTNTTETPDEPLDIGGVLKKNAWPIALVLTAIVSASAGYGVGTLKGELEHLRSASSTQDHSLADMDAKITLLENARAVTAFPAPAQSPQIQLQSQIAAVPTPAPAYPATDTAAQQFAGVPALQNSTPLQSTPVTAVQPQMGLNADGVPTQAAAVFDNPELAGQLLNAFSQTNGIRTEGATETTGHPVYAFFDPRCPFCEKAVGELVGDVPVHWIPTTLLGDTENGIQVVEAMFQAEDKAAAMLAGHAGTIPPVSASAETRQAVNENAAVLYSVMGGAERSIAVPTILVPKPDGTIEFFRGFVVGDGAAISAAYGG